LCEERVGVGERGAAGLGPKPTVEALLQGGAACEVVGGDKGDAQGLALWFEGTWGGTHERTCQLTCM
jgi:hypothetical protein